MILIEYKCWFPIMKHPDWNIKIYRISPEMIMFFFLKLIHLKSTLSHFSNIFCKMHVWKEKNKVVFSFFSRLIITKCQEYIVVPKNHVPTPPLWKFFIFYTHFLRPTLDCIIFTPVKPVDLYRTAETVCQTGRFVPPGTKRPLSKRSKSAAHQNWTFFLKFSKNKNWTFVSVSCSTFVWIFIENQRLFRCSVNSGLK